MIWIFYLFAVALVFSATLTVTLRQPVTSVLCLIWSFFNAAGLFLTLGAEFLAFIVLIVYVGAVAVLFLFVVMMLGHVDDEKKKKLRRLMPVGLGIALALLMQMSVVIWSWPAPIIAPHEAALTNTQALGQVLYTTYLYPFQVCGLILLVAMVGAIVLTLRRREGVKRQNVWDQLGRRREEAIEIHRVKSGEGLP